MSATQQNALLREHLVQEGQTASSEEEQRRGVYAGRLLEGRFYLEKRLTEEPLGVVYGAVDRARHQRVWVRLFPRQISTDKFVQERLDRDLRILSALQHKNILSILHVGNEEGFGAFVVSEACLGHSLRSMMGSWGALSREQVAKIWPAFCDAMHFAHRKGISHGYLSPSHLWWSAGQAWSDVRVSWFGVPRLMGLKTAEMVSSTSSAFSLKYRSPEQAEAFEKADHRSDIYAAGLLLFELLTGQHPLDVARWGQREREWMPMLDWRERHLLAIPPRLSQVVPKMLFPEALESLLSSMLQKDPSLRPQSMQEVLDLWQEAIAQWNPPSSGEIPLEIPRELPPEGWRVSTLGALGLQCIADRVEAWQQVLPAIPAALRPIAEGWLEHSALSEDGGGSLSEPLLQKLQGEGAWSDLLCFHLQRGVSTGLSQLLVQQIPEQAQAQKLMERLASQSRRAQDTGVLRRVPTSRGRAATQEVTELVTGQKSQSVQAIAAEEILSLSELEARLPSLARIQQSEEGLPNKLSPPEDTALRVIPGASLVEGVGIHVAEEEDPETRRRNWLTALLFFIFLLVLTGLISWYLRGGAQPSSAPELGLGEPTQTRDLRPKPTKPLLDKKKSSDVRQVDGSPEPISPVKSQPEAKSMPEKRLKKKRRRKKVKKRRKTRRRKVRRRKARRKTKRRRRSRKGRTVRRRKPKRRGGV